MNSGIPIWDSELSDGKSKENLTCCLMKSHIVRNNKHASLLNYSSSLNFQSSVAYEITQFPSPILYNIHFSPNPVTNRPAIVDFFGGRL